MLAIALIGWCALCRSPFLEGVSTARRQGDSAETQRQTAQITLLVLRTTVEGAESVRKYFFLPSRAPLSLDEAVRALATSKKPVRCAGAMEGATLAVACRPLDGAEALWHDQDSARGVTFWAADVRKRCSEPIGEARLLLHRRGTSMMVRFRALATWLRDYDIDHSLGGVQSTKPPPGVCMVLEVGPPGTMKIQADQTGPVRS